MSSIINLKAKGLNLSPNPLDAQEGSLIEAKNIVIRRDDVIEPRRGFKLYGDAFPSITDRAKQLSTYKSRILRYYDSKLQFDDGSGTFSTFDGNYSETETGLRIKSIESNGNYYFTTSTGIKKLSAKSASEFTTASNYITNAGGVKALDINGRVNIQLGNETGFLPGDAAVAYRAVWGYKDANENLVLGTPSQRVEVYNPLLTLVLEDYMNVLEALDAINQAGSMVDDGNYVEILKLGIDASVDELRTNLIALALKLDTDIFLADTIGSLTPLKINSVSISAGVCTITFNAGPTVSDYLSAGDSIFLTNFVPGTSGTLDGAQTIASVGASTLTFNTTATGSVTITGATIYSNTFRAIAEPPVPNAPATHGDTANCQTYLNDILTALAAEPNAIISTSLSNAYLVPISLTTTATVILDITIPQDIILNKHFLQIYRSNIAQADDTSVLSTDVFPDDELQLVYEAFPTSAEISALTMQVEDITPDAFRGANLYTNAVTGEGIAQANDIPPFAKDINFFKNVIFYANTRTRFRQQISLLGVVNLIDSFDSNNPPKLIIKTPTTEQVYQFVVGVKEETTVQTVAQSLIPAASYFYLNSANDINQYYVWFDTTGSDTDPAIAGRTGIKVDVSNETTADDVATKLNNVLALYIADFNATVSTDTVTITNVDQGITTDASDAGATGFTITVTTQGKGEDASTNTVLLSSSVSPSIAVEQTVKSLIRVINKNTADSVYAYYLSGVQDIPGKFLLETRGFTADTFYIMTNTTEFGALFNPDIGPIYSVASGTSITVDSPTQITLSSASTLVSGDKVLIVGSQTTPSIDGEHVITVIDSTNFTIPVAVTVSPSVLANQIGVSKISDVQTATDEEKPNRIYYSKYQQPEAVPILNYFDVGASDKKILRIYPLRDSLFVFKEDGLFRVSGEVAPFTVALFDSSCNLIVPDSVSIGNNQIYCWSTQGISTVTESGVNIISRPIDTEILKLATAQFTNFKTATWGIGDDSDNSYFVWTIKNTNDTVAQMAYRFNNLTNTWTTVEKSNTCGVKNPADDRLYLGAGDVAYIEQERKNFNRYDYADQEIVLTLLDNNYFGLEIQLTSVTGLEVGDVLVQEQTLNTFIFNNLLETLDTDPSLGDGDYFSTLETTGGDNLSNALTDLINKVADDTGRQAQSGALPDTDYTDLLPVPSDFIPLQTKYNEFILLINSDPGLTFSSYKLIDSTSTLETIISGINTGNKRITVEKVLDFIPGPITIFKAIPLTYAYTPITMSDPLGFKHLREATIMFQNKAFTSAILSFATDLFPQYVDVEFQADGNGAFGNDPFGTGFFGGDSHSAPFRTYIPRQCQRCRYLLIRFEHQIAREKISVYGVTVTGEISQSERAYRR